MKQSIKIGMAAVLLWSLVAAFARTTSEAFGWATASGIMNFSGAVVGYIYLVIRRKHREVFNLRWVDVIRGSFFVAYSAIFFYSISQVPDELVHEVAAFDQSWPIWTALLGVLVLRQKVRKGRFFIAILLLVSGLFLVKMNSGVDFSEMKSNLRSYGWVYALALSGGLCWGVFSVLTAKYKCSSEPTVLFLLVSGILSLIISFREPILTPATVGLTLQLVALGFIAGLANYAWSHAVQDKEAYPKIAAFANFGPLISALVTSLHLGILPGWSFWVGATLIAAGIVASNKAIMPTEESD